ncbi:MAG TPA: ABC transporter permease [Candidatus Eisenbacteria bacterium]|nr:ABC transporter permease [Candidatus Eisenbacteria bacterium]
MTALLIAWEVTARLGAVNPLIMPAPSRIFVTFLSLIVSGQIPRQILISLERAATGYLLAALVCIPAGVLMGLFERVYRALVVVVEMLRPVPPPVVIPVALLFFGLEDAMKIFVIFFSCAWPILLNTLDGVKSIDPVLLNTARTFGLSRWRAVRQVVLPAASPQILTGLRVSLPITLILVVISEMVGSTDGIGYFILDSQRRFRVSQMYAGMLALAILGYLLNQLFDLAHRRALPWHRGVMREKAIA